jgi:hypothetical protein
VRVPEILTKQVRRKLVRAVQRIANWGCAGRSWPVRNIGSRAEISTVKSEPEEPAVDIKKSVRPDMLICLDCGKAFRSRCSSGISEDHKLTPLNTARNGVCQGMQIEACEEDRSRTKGGADEEGRRAVLFEIERSAAQAQRSRRFAFSLDFDRHVSSTTITWLSGDVGFLAAKAVTQVRARRIVGARLSELLIAIGAPAGR